MSFCKWLKEQKNRGDHIGDLACDVFRGGRNPSTVAEIESDMNKINPWNRYGRDALKDALKEFNK